MLIPTEWMTTLFHDWSNFGWIFLMGFLVNATCGLAGNFLILKRMSLMGDAISHSVLPGLALGFLIAQSRSTLVMLFGAMIAAIVTSLMIELIHRHSKIKQDAAMGIVFSMLFALGVVLITLFSGHIDLDADCVLYGEIAYVAFTKVDMGVLGVVPEGVLRMFVMLMMVIAGMIIFYRKLLILTFDSVLSAAMGMNVQLAHHLLMLVVSMIIVSAFESVGAILVIAMLILPGAHARLLSDRLPTIFLWTLFHALIVAILGVHLGIWLGGAIAPAMVVVSFLLFCSTWLVKISWERLHSKTITHP